MTPSLAAEPNEALRKETVSMAKMMMRRSWQFLLFATLSGGFLSAQMTVTGSIAGTVIDPSGQVVAGAKITITSPRTSESRTATASESGSFSVVAVQPDTYDVRIEQRGFKIYERRGVGIGANERVALGDVILQVGDVTETVTVMAEAAHVQTDSSEHSATLTTNQLSNLTARGRDVVSMLRTIAGVQYQADQDAVGGAFVHEHTQHRGSRGRHEHTGRGRRRQ
jgi:hypothetical protein